METISKWKMIAQKNRDEKGSTLAELIKRNDSFEFLPMEFQNLHHESVKMKYYIKSNMKVT